MQRISEHVALRMGFGSMDRTEILNHLHKIIITLMEAVRREEIRFRV